MSTPRHRTAPGTSYFVTTKCWQSRSIFQIPGNVEILVSILFHYRERNAYLLHEFVVMPNHLHVLLTPSSTTSLERSIQLIKGASSREIHKQRGHKVEIWQQGFHDWTIRDEYDWATKAQYIVLNPVRAGLTQTPLDWPYSSASVKFELDPMPRKYLTSGAEAPTMPVLLPGLKPRPPKEKPMLPKERHL
jgi:putative transposase